MTLELSILVAAHREGLIAHKTMRSIERSLSTFKDLEYEIIVTIDNGDEATKSYFHNYKKLPITIYEIDEKDLAASRNFAVKKSSGKYISIVDADDLVSKNWLKSSINIIRNAKEPCVLHTQYSVNFGTQDIIWEKFDSRSKEEDATIMVWANRWDSAIVTQREVLEKFPYQPNTDGFGSEDWHFNSQTLAADIPHRVVSQTILFVRRKDVSEMTIQATDRRTVHYTELLSLEALRASHTYQESNNKVSEPSIPPLLHAAKHYSKLIAKKTLRPVHRLAKRNVRYRDLVHSLRHKESEHNNRFPNWLVTEWRAIHEIEKSIFPSQELLDSIPVYHSEMYDLGEKFRHIVNQFSTEPDYIIFVPSLNRGGAELVVLNYVSALRTEFPDWQIAVVATEDLDHPWSNQLPSDVDYIEFGKLTEGFTQDHKLMLLARLIVQSKARRLHIAQSGLMYKFSGLYAKLLSNYRVYAFAFCEDEDNEGRISGQIHSGLPLAYPTLTHIFSDNQYVIDQLVKEYAFNSHKFSTLYQPFNHKLQEPIAQSGAKLKVLWASRISKQKRPDILIDIAKKIDPDKFNIHMYGLLQDGFEPEDFAGIDTLQYKGEFSSIDELNLRDYDLFLYTSENDGIPNILLEVGAAGLPLIVPSIGGIPELVSSKNPMLVQHFDDVNEYVTALNSFQRMEISDRIKLAEKIQATINKQHSPEKFNQNVKSILSK